MGGGERARELERKRLKELMCERLGLELGGEGEKEGEKENGLNELPSLERKELGKEKDEKDEEVKSLRKQVMRLNEENKRLNARVKGLQEEVVAAKASASARQGTMGTTSTASALEGVGAIQLKELEKSFAE
ncbi:BQ5605_C020g09196 [Microbotryum silenes-dioicae]|uniref:BQ5605_C020g09196 protein n=1 Tax=Microbotryum silenes-dioicae TaxID=796604 RepID=A0A2X0MN65_9BASI|nr:BQ5605_C020g09196 [Microbotryum silenes-dioicae]